MITIKDAKLPFCDYYLHIKQGEKVAILGASGSGKSTLLNLLAGFTQVNNHSNSTTSHSTVNDNKNSHYEYKLELNGKDHRFSHPSERPISILFQTHNLFDHLTVYQNIALGLDPKMRINTSQKTSIEQLCKQIEIDQLLDRLPDQLSGGQKQRVALARCFLRDKPILLLDEPFSALDPKLRQTMLQLLNEIASEKNITVLMVTHNHDDAFSFADRVIELENGNVLFDETITEFMQKTA